MLFSYSNSDPTYTLAPTVGWTTIEMSAGIVSACLPTLQPVLAWCVSKLGIKRTLITSRGGTTGNTSGSKAFGQSATDSVSDRTEVELQRARKGSAGAVFYRLPDGQASGDPTQAVDSELRPTHGHRYTVTSRPVHGDGESLSGDEVPLHGIRVHTEFKQSTG